MLQTEMAYLDDVPIQVHEQDITQVIAPERLVYLSPNSDHVLEELNPSDCYVIGCIVDRGEKVPLTLDKATKLNIRTARLPIDRFVSFRMHKELNLDHVMQILLTAKDSSDWQKKIIKHIPNHKYAKKKVMWMIWIMNKVGSMADSFRSQFGFVYYALVRWFISNLMSRTFTTHLEQLDLEFELPVFGLN